jgi:hypothetical protein
VSDIRVTDALENYYFGNLMVARIYHGVGNARVYNFEVEDFHTYYVGELGLWVHNKCEAETVKVPSLEALTDKVEIYKKIKGARLDIISRFNLPAVPQYDVVANAEGGMVKTKHAEKND